MSKKEQVLVTRVTKKDLRVDYFRCSGPGGQKVNKTSSGVRFTHEPSGAVVQSTESRKRSENEHICMKKLSEHPKFVIWARKLAAEDTVDKEALEKRLDTMLLPFHYEVEVYEEGKWVKPSKDLE